MAPKVLDECFDKPTFGPELRWHCEPAQWSIDPTKGVLRITPDARTDFWQRTHYGFEPDSEHLLHLRAIGDFILTTKVTSHIPATSTIGQGSCCGFLLRVG